MAAMSADNLVIYVATTQRGGGQQEWDKWNELDMRTSPISTTMAGEDRSTINFT
uniref:Uncharacterized protein n=2 Tax=Oryza TaxID=4527 RepID=Q6EN55_ORYSJ|nr:hypothetical protein [Oryza sativa Japonica Group]BAD29680.1 hypothetical protein [Oryza sativa Japonica Group]